MRKTRFLADVGLSRREFARGAACLAATAALLPVARGVQAQEPAASAPSAPKLSPAAAAEVEAKFQAILRKYGARLSAAEKADLRRELAQAQDGLDKLRAFPLENADAPAAVFQAARARGQ